MRRFAFLVPGLIVAALIIGAYVWYLNAALFPSGPVVQTEGEAEIGGPFSLIDQDGVRRTDADFRGKYMLIFFGFTHCPDVCPTTLAILSGVLRELGETADEVVPVFVTVDPARDTPEAMKAYLSAFDPRFVGLTGSEEEVAQIAQAYKVYYQLHTEEGEDYSVDHSSIVYLMDRQGAYVANYTLQDGIAAIAEDVARRITPAS